MESTAGIDSRRRAPVVQQRSGAPGGGRYVARRMLQDVANGDKDIVTALRSALAGEVGQERFDLWFGDRVELRLTERAIVVCAADQFTLDRIRRQFRKTLVHVGRQVTGRELGVEYALTESPQQTSPADPPQKKSSNNQQAARNLPATINGKRGRRFASLEQFVVGDCNRVAHTAAKMVTQRLGAASPLFVYGPTGTGKTHLLEGIWSAARRQIGGGLVLYLSAEQFTSMFLEALRGGGLPNFRHKYRQVDVLLLDDVQFFLGKQATLVELHHTIDALLRKGRQLVVAADRSPAELVGFGPELAARLSAGLVCAVERPDLETRRGILQQHAARLPRTIPDEVLQLIAAEYHGDARQLRGALNQLVATSQAFGQAITLDMARATLTHTFRATRPVVGLADIDRAVCDVFGLEPKTLQSARRARTVTQPRALAMWLARKYTRSAYSEIGAYFGRRSHSTVISAEKQVGRWVEQGQTVQMPYGQCQIDEAIRRVESQMRAG